MATEINSVWWDNGVVGRAFNFGPGPAGMPAAVLAEIGESLSEYGDLRASIMEVSHRGAAFMRVYEEAQTALRRLLSVPDDYAVLFLGGGATGQMAAAPMNLSAPEQATAHIISGRWSSRAAAEAKKYGRVAVLADTAENNENGAHIDLPTQLRPAGDAAYCHYADNETVNGVEFDLPPQVTVPLVVDMSSNILTRPININDYGLIYAGAQKNLGPAGVTVVVVRRDLIQPRAQTPAVWNYAEQYKHGGMLNTPPTFAIYAMGVYLKWLQARGGVVWAQAQSAAKSQCLYEVLDENDFYFSQVTKRARSRINIPFFLRDESLTEKFLHEAEAHNFIGLRGHKVLGGCRASLYNAMSLDGTQQLADFMRNFARRYG